MRKLLALLLLAITSPAIAQQVDWYNAVNVPNIVVNPSMNDCPSDIQSPTCGAWKTAPGPGDWTNQFGSTEYVFSYVDGRLYQDIDLSDYQTKAFNFYFDFDLNNSCRNSIGGYCGNVDGPIDFISAKVRFYDQNGLNNEFTFLNGNVSTASVQCDFELLGICFGGYTAYDNWQHFGWYSSVQSDSLFTSAQIEFTGRDVGFWGGLYGPRVDNPTLQINYIPPPYPTVGGDPGMNVSAPGSDYIFIYKGNDPVLFSQLAIKGDNLIGWTAVTPSGENLMVTDVERAGPDYLFLHTDGAPASGSWYSFQQQAPEVDCARTPSNTACIISAVNISTDTTTADAPSSSTASTIDVSPTQSATTEIVANTGGSSVESFAAQEKVASDPVLAASVANEAVATAAATTAANPLVSSPGTQAAYRELTDEEKAAILADAISKNVIEGALTTIAATSAASASNGSQDGSTSTTTTKKDTSTDNTVDANSVMIAENNQSAQTETTDTSGGLEILETGRVKAQESIAATMAATENSANESMSQAES
ncbi:MAG: hypothetical protein EBU08_16715, partial [Micrococcales bacterium]|nr:hypothetical protein [Micrococcales bacterium]